MKINEDCDHTICIDHKERLFQRLLHMKLMLILLLMIAREMKMTVIINLPPTVHCKMFTNTNTERNTDINTDTNTITNTNTNRDTNSDKNPDTNTHTG